MTFHKKLLFDQLFKTAFRTAVVSTLASLILGSIAAVLFVPPDRFVSMQIMVLFIAAFVSYFSASVVFRLRQTIEEQQVKLALEQQRALILSRFVRDAAHEFKTPLTLIGTSLYLLEKTTDPTKKHEYAHKTQEQIHVLNTLVETILTLTQLDTADKATYPSEQVKPAELIAGIKLLDNRRVKIRVEHVETLPSVQVNLVDIHLALKEIVENALRFSPDSSEVSVKMEPSGKWLMLQIGDEGQGMSAETIEHIFDRFYRVDESHTTRGLGLGLAIAKRVIDLHNGRIEVQSELGKGTTIRTYLPIS